MADFISIDIGELNKSITNLTDKFGRLGKMLGDKIPAWTAPAVVKLMQIYEPPKHVTRRAAYGRTFQSAKMRSWFFWALRTGRIQVPYIRTFGMRSSWRIEGKGRQTVVVNHTDAARYTMGDETQSRHERLVGWHTTGWRLQHPTKEIAEAATNGVKDAIKRLGLA